jgi:GAF domain-containing protein
VLYEIVHTLVANLQMEEILPSVLETLRELFAYDRCALAGRNEDGALTSWASYPAGVVPFSRTIAERVLDQGEALLCDDTPAEAPSSPSESTGGHQIRSVLCSPLIFRGQIRGVIYLDRSLAGAYTLDDLALLRHVCDLVAIALENARLFTDLRARFQESTERLKEVQTRLVESEQVAALGRLAQALSHEVRNPIVVIGGMSRRLGRKVRDPEVAADVEAIVAEAQRLEVLLQHVEDVVALPEASFHLAPLEDVVGDALASAGIWAEVDSRLGRRSIPHDPVLTRAALAATLRKASVTGAHAATLQVVLDETGKGWSIRIHDGARDGERKDFFDPFFRTHPWADDLALTLAATAMARQGGNLRLGIDPGRGTDIELTLSALAVQEMGSDPGQGLHPES